MLKAEWPLVGRDAELSRLRALVDAPGCHALVLSGPPGVGKTRLASELSRHLEPLGIGVVRIAATQTASALPLGAVAFLLPPTASEESAASDPDAVAPGDLSLLLRRTADALIQRATGRPLLVLVDDAHWLDDASAVLIHQLAATGVAFVLATLPNGAEPPAAISDLWRTGLGERVILGGLAPAAVDEVLRRVLGAPLDPVAVEVLVEHAQGNMLFLRELILGGLDAGTLRNDGGIWRLTGPLAPSDRLRDLVGTRLRRLDGAERDLLEAVAVGEPLGIAELASFGDADLVRGLEVKGLLRTRMDGRRLEVRLAHPVHGDVLRDELTPLRARRLAGHLADAVQATGARRRNDVMRMAMWRLEAGVTDPALMLAGARTARARHDLDLAERLAGAAIEADGGFPARLLSAQLTALRGHGEDAERLLAALAPGCANDGERGQVAVARLDNLATYLGRLPEALAVAEEAEAAIGAARWRDEITARRAGILICLDGPERAVAAAEPVYLRGRGRAHSFACAIMSHACGRLGRLDDALAAAERGERAHLAVSGLFERAPWIHAWWRGDALAYGGRILEAERLAGEQYEQGLAERSREAQAWFAWQLARRALERGHLDRAIRYAVEALAVFRELGRRSFEQAAGVHLTTALALRGRRSEAAAALSALTSMGPVVWMPVELLEARAWVAAAAGRDHEAHTLLWEAAAHGRRGGDRIGEASALHTLARLGRARETAPRLWTLAGLVDGELVTLRARHTAALADRDTDALDEVSSRFEALGLDLLAAEAAAVAGAEPSADGETRRTAHAQVRAKALVERCDGAITPALLALRLPAHLTQAELRAAVRAASGMSNKEIAAELGLSPRTVGNQLQSTYRKLGVTHRAELSALLAGSSI